MREVVSLPSSIPSCSKFSLDQSGGKCIEAHLLHQQSFKGSKRTISTHGKACIFISDSSKEA